MFVSGQSVYAGMVFSFLSFLVAIPSAIKVFNWTATLYKGSISYDDADALCARLHRTVHHRRADRDCFWRRWRVDVHVHDTYFVVAHFHYIMVGGAVMGYLGGIHYWWPKISGKLYPEGWAQLSALVVFIGFNLTFFPQFIARLSGNAAALSCLSDGVPGVERDVDGGCLDPRGRLSDPVILPDLVAALWQAGASESVGRYRSGMADTVAAANVANFDKTPSRDGRGRTPTPMKRR